MVKNLTKHGNSQALVIDRTIMELMGIDHDTPLELRVSGQNLIVSPVQQVVPDEAFDKAADEVFERYDDMLRRLA